VLVAINKAAKAAASIGFPHVIEFVELATR
jgi:hypothetical protein